MESPTPWHVGGIGGCRPKLVYDASGRTILRSWGSRGDEEDDANVELAAQAPKLREQVRILREALEWYATPERWKGEPTEVFLDGGDVARDALKHLPKESTHV